MKIKGIIAILVLLGSIAIISITANNSGKVTPAFAKATTTEGYVAPEGVKVGLMTPVEIQVPEEYPKTREARLEAIKLYLGLLGEGNNLATWERILVGESGGSNFDLYVTPKFTEVKHCKTASGSYYAVEIAELRPGYWGQADCKEGDTETKAEKSTGMFQILPSTWKGNKCGGSFDSWKAQVECAVAIKNRSGFTQWATY